MANEFDVFLSHNSQDKPIVEAIAGLLKAQGVRVWLDKDELRPGLPWHQGLQEGIQASKAVAVFIGQYNPGAWQDPEMWAFVDRSRRDKTPVIPVLLPDCPESPELDLFLRAFTWVDFRGGITDDGIDRLVWGITGKKPGSTNPSQPSTPSPGLLQSPASRNLPAAQESKKPRPRWEAWGLGIAVLGVLVAIGAWLWLISYEPKKPELYEVRVQLLDPDGRPVGGGKIRTSTGNEAHFLPQDEWWEIQIPSFKVPKDGKVTIWAEHDDWESGQTDLVLGDDRNVPARIQLKSPQSVIRGTVIDGENHALAGATITPDDGKPGSATSGPDGAFAIQLPVPRESKIGLRAELKGWKPDTTYCYAGRDGCHLVLTKP